LAEGPLALGADVIQVVIVAALITLAVAAAGAAAIAGRRTLIGRAGSVECGLRHGAGRRWRLGLAEYQPDALRWHPVFGVRLRASEVFPRRALIVTDRRPADPVEVSRLGPGTVIVECDTGEDGGRVELALSQDALTGFLAWLEAAPPGPRSAYR
jgi:hypothetical protein